MARRRSTRAILLAAGAILLAALMLGSTGLLGVGRDPSVARIVNDLNVPVRLRLCSSDDCRHGFAFDSSDGTLRPGEDWPVNVSSIGVPNVYLVESGRGLRLGCLPLVSPALRPEIKVFVSEHIPSRGDLDEDTFWPRRWANNR
jgi:hypothetical protein